MHEPSFTQAGQMSATPSGGHEEEPSHMKWYYETNKTVDITGSPKAKSRSGSPELRHRY